jgi:hypothetical protein
MDSRNKTNTSDDTVIASSKYENIPRYFGRAGSVAGGVLGYKTGTNISAISRYFFNSPTSYSRMASTTLFFGSVGYACGFFSGKLAVKAHVPESVEKGWDLIKKL